MTNYYVYTICAFKNYNVFTALMSETLRVTRLSYQCLQV